MKYIVTQVHNWDGTINAPKSDKNEPTSWPTGKGATLQARAENGDEVSFQYRSGTSVDHQVGDEIEVTIE